MTYTPLPDWFHKVAEEAEARLDEVYRTNPNALSSWYLQHRKEKEEALEELALRDGLE